MVSIHIPATITSMDQADTAIADLRRQKAELSTDFRFEEAEELQGQDVRVKIGIEPASGEFPAKNKVTDYVHKKEVQEPEKRPAATAKQEAEAQDDIPF
jgi:hypothetical protein